MAAGLVDDPRAMLPRLNALLERVVGVETGSYTGIEALEGKRWVSPAEAKERDTIAKGEELAQGIELMAKEKEKS